MNLAAIAHAEEISVTLPGPANVATQGPVAIIVNVYYTALMLAGLLALGVLVYAGLMRIFQAGSASGMGESKKWFAAAGTGLILLLGAYVLLAVINPGLNVLQFPQLSRLTAPVLPDNAGAGNPCAADGSCTTPAVCSPRGLCVNPGKCFTPADCTGANTACIGASANQEGTCQAAGGGAACTSRADCGGGLACIGGACSVCTKQSDCGGNILACSNGQCLPLTGQPPNPSASCNNASNPCGSPYKCSTSFQCLVPCTNSTSCPNGHACTADSGGTKFCSP